MDAAKNWLGGLPGGWATAGIAAWLVLAVACGASADLKGSWSFESLVGVARQRAKEPYEKPADDLPKALRDLDYDGYRDITYRRSKALWASEGLPFQVEFFHRGYLFRRRVGISIVDGGKAAKAPFSPEQFDYGSSPVGTGKPAGDLGFAGFRLLYPIDPSGHHVEFASFLGASYFRAIGATQFYGASARGVAIGLGLPDEEFPAFEAFWLEKPRAGAETITVYALLDGPSVTGAYRFEIRPGSVTRIDVGAEVFARKTFDEVGIAPLTSMYFYGRSGPSQFQDHRPQVHDSDGLLIANGQAEWLWRPLWNPKALSLSTFEVEELRGFGLMQRDRDPDHYRDPNVLYEKRPSVWVEPVSPWKGGNVRLLELATDGEGQDNIGVCWIPPASLKTNDSLSLRYRLHFGESVPESEDIGRVVATRWSQSGGAQVQFEVDFDLSGVGLDPDQAPEATISADGGQVDAVRTQRDPSGRYWRATFEAAPHAGQIMEIRASLGHNGRTLTEVWSFLWPR